MRLLKEQFIASYCTINLHIAKLHFAYSLVTCLLINKYKFYPSVHYVQLKSGMKNRLSNQKSLVLEERNTNILLITNANLLLIHKSYQFNISRRHKLPQISIQP